MNNFIPLARNLISTPKKKEDKLPITIGIIYLHSVIYGHLCKSDHKTLLVESDQQTDKRALSYCIHETRPI